MDRLGKLFEGPCSGKPVTIDLTKEWEEINSEGCQVVHTVIRGPLEGRDENGEEFIVRGHMTQELHAVRAMAGSGRIKYSKCPRFTPLPADWDCSPLPKTANK
jgi:hypothetical protein